MSGLFYGLPVTEALFSTYFKLTLKYKVLFMEDKKYVEDLQEIRKMMRKSSRFTAFNGISVIIAGVMSLIGAYFAYYPVLEHEGPFGYEAAELSYHESLHTLLVAIAVILVSAAAVFFFSNRKAQKEGRKFWDLASRRAFMSMGIPLIAGGLFCLILFNHGLVGIVIPLTLIFYGLGLISASKMSLAIFQPFGFIQILLGLLGTYFISKGIFFWVLGFGLVNIFMGIVIITQKEA